MNQQELYRLLARLLVFELGAEDIGDGVVVTDDEGVKWLLTAEEVAT